MAYEVGDMVVFDGKTHIFEGYHESIPNVVYVRIPSEKKAVKVVASRLTAI
jgi:hypothetical protein